MQRLAERLWMLDVKQFGVLRYGSVYVLGGRHPALVETGTSVEAPRVLSGLRSIGIRPEQVRWIFVTHVHLDHAGGAGTLLWHMPKAEVAVHARGAKHLADPSRLLASVKKATGRMAESYGTAEPIHDRRIVTPSDGDTFDLGGMRLTAIATPGHAPHHLCYLEEEGKWLFSGDAAGIWREGGLLPTTPPPNFELSLWESSLARLAALEPSAILYTHFGPNYEGGDALRAYLAVLRSWVKRVEDVWCEAGRDDGAAVSRLLADPELRRWPYNDHAREAELEMCVRGVLHYLRRRENE